MQTLVKVRKKKTSEVETKTSEEDAVTKTQSL